MNAAALTLVLRPVATPARLAIHVHAGAQSGVQLELRGPFETTAAQLTAYEAGELAQHLLQCAERSLAHSALPQPQAAAR